MGTDAAVFNSDVRRWAEETFGQAELGDRRRTARLVDVAARIAAHPCGSILEACQKDKAAKEGTYGFIENGRVDPMMIGESGFAASAQAALGLGLVVVATDTTLLSFQHGSASAWGDLGGPEGSVSRGFFCHSSVLLDGYTRRVIGLADQQWWQRDAARSKSEKRRQRPYQEKESYKWEQAGQRVQERLRKTGVTARVITVSDRESDVYEYLQYCLQHDRLFVVRAAENRCLACTEGKLWEYLAAAPVLGVRTARVAQRGGRPARDARVVLRSARVTLQPPSREVGPQLPPIEVNVVLAREEDAPAGVEALEWMLLTSEPVESMAEASGVVDTYLLRWSVEEFHKAWKSGCKVEGRRMQEPDHMTRLAVILAFVAIRLLRLQALKDEQAESPCTEILEEDEYQCLWHSVEKDKPIPSEVPTVQWAYYALAGLGGWHDTQRTGRVGWISLWRGWFRLQERVAGWRLGRQATTRCG